MSNYRDRVPCFCRFTGWRSRLSRSNLVAVAVATLHLAKEINYFGPLPLHQFLRRKRRQFFDARRATLSGQLRAPACQESAGTGSKRPERHFLERHFMAFGPHFKQTRSAGISRAQLAPERASISSRSGVQAFRDRRQAVQECWHFTNAGILRRRHFHVSYVMCPVSCVRCYVSCLMPHVPVSYVVCYVSCVRCHVLCGICHETCVMCRHIRAICRVSCAICHGLCVMFRCVICHVPYVMFHLSCVRCHVSCVMSHVLCVSFVMCHVSGVMCRVSCVI
jgi:hypothetical protein